ncbi:TniQ family protein [Paenibacillus silviterrae]|uniref:TniQ family protein n=1 Tax=Paenibacillus silviterrae TaxID=3242194 RepID=UPI0025432996|nr:TniQ family protein [Paenibacillus chinjuensis]
MNLLRNRPDIRAHESLASFVHRISIANHYPSVSTIATALNIKMNRLNNNEFSPHQLLLLQGMTGLPFETLQDHTCYRLEQMLGINHFAKFIMKNRVKYCPYCFQEDRIHKYTWSCYPLNICVKHQMFLLEECSSCKGKILLRNLLSEKCQCGYLYKDAHPIAIENDVILKSQTFLYESCFNSDYSQPFLSLSFRDTLDIFSASYHLLEGMNSYLGDELMIKAFSKQKDDNRSSKTQAHAFSNAFWMYMDFPNNFYKVLDDFRALKHPPTMYEQKKQFEKVLEFESLSEIISAYHKFWLEKIDQGIVRKDFSVFKKQPELLKRRKYLRKDKIRTAVGMSYGTITELNKQNEVTMQILDGGSHSKYLVDKNSFESVLHETQHLITKQEAALILGIQKDSIPKLISAGILKTYRKPTHRFEALSITEVKNLMKECRGRFVKGKVKGIGFHEALLKYSVCGMSIVRIINFTKAGMLRPRTNVVDGTLANNNYSERELEECVAIIRKEQIDSHGYYLSDVLKVLRIGEKRAWKLIESGELKPIQIVTLKDGRKRYLFNKDEIENLRCTC